MTAGQTTGSGLQVGKPEQDFSLQLANVRVFIAVAGSESVAKAAKQLYKAPSAVSRSIVELEKALGQVLFERSPRGIVLNNFGTLVLRRALRIEAELDEAAIELARIRGRSGSISPSAISHLLFNGRKLQLVVQLVQQRKISSAAKTLGVTQSGASMALSRIEGALGAPLFQRGMHGLMATEAANRLTVRARRVLAELRHMTSDVFSASGALIGTVVIGMLPLGRTYVFPMAIAEAISRHPDIHVRTIDSPFDQLISGLRAGDLDMIAGVPRPEQDRSGLEIEPLFQDRLTVVVRAGHPLLGRGRLGLPDVMAERWILPWASSPSRALFQRAFEEAGLVAPVPSVESADLAVVRQLVTASDALALVSARQMLFELRSGLLVELPVDLPDLARDVGLITREGAMLSPVAEALRAAIRTQATLARDALD